MSTERVKLRPGHPWAGNVGTVVPDPSAPLGMVKIRLDTGWECYASPSQVRRVESLRDKEASTDG